MTRAALFIKLYRNKKAQNIILFTVYILLSAIISMVLFVQTNNRDILSEQFAKTGMGNFDMESTFQVSENILGIIAIAAIAVGALGISCLIWFRNSSLQKSQIMFRIMGMETKDIFLKAMVDAVLFGLMSSLAGFFLGYGIFVRFSQVVLETDIFINIISVGCVMIYVKTAIYIAFYIITANLLTDIWIMEKPISEILYERKYNYKVKKVQWIVLGMIAFLIAYSVKVFSVSLFIIRISTLIGLIISTVLLLIFKLIFGRFLQKRREKIKIATASDISFCFLCSRNRRNALLAIAISIGTIIICIVSNIQFNIGGMIKSAYRDNMGYSIVVRVDDYTRKDEIKSKLDGMNIGYTYGYSKLEDYSALNANIGINNKFWALVIEQQTDNNSHFSVPVNCFMAEKYFATQCQLIEGKSTGIFGNDVVYVGNLQDNQYMSLVSYSFIVNKEDWNLGIDETWSPVFLIDASARLENNIANQVGQMGCHIESASELIDGIKELLTNYIYLIILVSIMLTIMTASIFYTVIRTDLFTRRTEMYLYNIFGAFDNESCKIIYREYIIVAVISSAAVSFTIMICGELFFYLCLGKHFPLSVVVTIITITTAVIFVMMCCMLAGYVNKKNADVGVIRDE